MIVPEFINTTTCISKTNAINWSKSLNRYGKAEVLNYSYNCRLRNTGITKKYMKLEEIQMNQLFQEHPRMMKEFKLIYQKIIKTQKNNI